MSLLDEHGQPIQPTKPATIRVVICMPTRGECKYQFTTDLAKLVDHTARERPDIEILFKAGTGTLIHDLRNKIAGEALELNPDYLFWLDDDMKFPADSLIHLIGRGQDIVGANYTTRAFPIRATAKTTADEIDFVDLPTMPDSTGLQSVDVIGFGCVLIRASVFRKLEQWASDKRIPPWFSMPYSPVHKKHTGEDVYFCTLARRIGIPTYVDHDLSKLIVHLGAGEFTWSHYYAFQECLTEQPASEESTVQ